MLQEMCLTGRKACVHLEIGTQSIVLCDSPNEDDGCPLSIGCLNLPVKYVSRLGQTMCISRGARQSLRLRAQIDHCKLNYALQCNMYTKESPFIGYEQIDENIERIA